MKAVTLASFAASAPPRTLNTIVEIQSSGQTPQETPLAGVLTRGVTLKKRTLPPASPLLTLSAAFPAFSSLAMKWSLWAAALLWLSCAGTARATYSPGFHGSQSPLLAGVYILGWQAPWSGEGTHESALLGGSRGLLCPAARAEIAWLGTCQVECTVPAQTSCCRPAAADRRRELRRDCCATLSARLSARRPTLPDGWQACGTVRCQHMVPGCSIPFPFSDLQCA